MTKEQLIKMFKGALSSAKYYRTLRLNSDNGKYLELHLHNGKLWIAEKDLLIYFLPTQKYMKKNQLSMDYFAYGLTDKEFSDLKEMFTFSPSQRKSNERTEVPLPNTKNEVVAPLQTYERYKKSYPNLSDAEIIERIGNELSDKAETIGKLLDEKNQWRKGCIVDRIAVRNAVEKVKGQPIWHDADKVFPEFDEEILGYYEIESGDLTHRIHAICKLKSIHEDRMGKHPCYQEGGSTVPLLFWTELNDCPFSSMDKKTKNQENENN